MKKANTCGPEGVSSKAAPVELIVLSSGFQTKDGRVFRKVEKMRSRYRCIEEKTGKIYLVPGLMEVEVVLNQ